ncbi:MAG: hypothetical protein ACE366_09690 [Bradymonadia bacterium]
MSARGLLTVAVLLIAWPALTGCGGYANTSEAFRRSMAGGQPGQALVAANTALGVDDAKSLPKGRGPDTPLLLLERATILQAMGEYELSARDFQAADKNLEVLDFTSDTAGSIGKYLYSDDSTVYKAPPHEKLLVNTLNMLNYLVRGDLSGAKVEARRLTVNQKYYKDAEPDARGMMAFSSYLAGFTFEMAGDAQEAQRYYGDAQEAGGVPTLKRAARRLHTVAGVGDVRLKGVLNQTINIPEAMKKPSKKPGDVLIVVQTGMAPFKSPKRVPIGAAIVSASQPGPGARLSRSEQRRANNFAAKGILKWVNYPQLKRYRSNLSSVNLSVDGKDVPGGRALDVQSRVVKEYQRIEGTLLAAAITRLLTRAVAGELTQAAASGKKKNSLAATLLGLAVEGALTAADTPDTRSWVTLPAQLYIARKQLPPGKHTIRLKVRGQLREAAVDLQPGGFAVVNFSDLR